MSRMRADVTFDAPVTGGGAGPVSHVEGRSPGRRAADPRARPSGGLRPLLGPAVVAAIAYVDPGNVATNLTAGATSRYRLVWVVVVASLVAILVQYQSAKLGAATG